MTVGGASIGVGDGSLGLQGASLTTGMRLGLPDTWVNSDVLGLNVIR